MSRTMLWACLVLFPAHALAQGTISGVATDVEGGVLPGVQVLLEAGQAAQPARTAVTDTAGRYTFRDVAAGTYSLRFVLPGFVTVARDAVTLAPAATATVDARMMVGALAEQFPRPRPFGPGPDRRCLHGGDETPAERTRREEAVTAMRMIEAVLRTFPGLRTESPSWEEVSESNAVRRLQESSNALAQKIRWGTREPLPGWGIAWLTSATRSRYALIDLRDPCGFSLSSEDPDLPQAGRYRIMPLGTH